MKFALLLISTVAFAAPSVVVTGTTSQQITLDIRGLTGTPQQCSVTAYLDAALTVKANDTNVAIFVGSESCPRAYNVVVGNQVTAVIGRRTSEPADCVSSCAETAGTLVSRSLELARAYWIKVTDTANSTSTVVTAVTQNIAWGRTHIEEVPFSPTAWSHWAYPEIDWSDAGVNKEYTDPVSGVVFRRIARNMMGKGGTDGNSPMQEFPFLDVVDINSAWTNPNNAKNTSTSGPFASYAGTNRDPLFLPFPSGMPASWSRVGEIPEDYGMVVYGSAVSTGNAEDLKILACLPIDYVPATNLCSNEIEIPLPTSTNSVSFPSTTLGHAATYPRYRFAGWGFPRHPNREQTSIVGCPSATVSSSVVTIGASSNCDHLPINIAPGQLFKVGSTMYHVGTLGTAYSFTLAESGINTSGAWQLGQFGLRIRKKTTTNNQINVAFTFRQAYDIVPKMPANSIPDFCSSVTDQVDREADGVTVINPPITGRLCVIGTDSKYLVVLLNDGRTRYLSDFDRYDQGCGGVSPSFPTGAWSNTNPLQFYATHMGDSGCHWSLFEVTYDKATCHWATNTGNLFHTVSKPNDCLNWVDKTPRTSGKSINQQLATPAAANPIWDASFNVSGFHFTNTSGDHAIFNYFIAGQDGPCIVATFNLTTYLFEAMWDSISGTLPGFRFGTCHSDGANTTNKAGAASFGYLIPGGKNDGYVGGPFLLQAATAKSLNGGSSWDSNTSLTNTQAGTCVGGGFGIAGLVQCFMLKLPSPTPCNTTAQLLDATKWPCTWHSGWSAPVTPIVAGDWFTRYADDHIDGKNEAMRILSVVNDPGVSGGVIVELLRWSVCQDVKFFNHINDPGGSTHPNGWRAVMVPPGECSTAIAWMDLGTPLGSRQFYVDGTAIISSHDGIGIAPDHTHTLQVGAGSSRSGTLPQAASNPIDHAFAINDSTFNGLHTDSGGNVEQYPSLGNWNCYSDIACSSYWDFRAINPDLGTVPEDFVNVWAHTYTLVSGQKFTYKVNVKDDFGDYKSRPANAFGARANFKDVSGPGSTISDSTPWTRCRAYKTGECSGATAGDLIVVAPTASPDVKGSAGCGSDATWAYSICATPLWSYAGWLIEQGALRDDPSNNIYRRIWMGMAGPSAHFQYSTPHMVPDTRWAFVRATVPNGVSPLPLLLKMPPPSMPDSVARDSFIKLPVRLPAGSGYMRVRFGNIENAPDSSHLFYCTSRQEECVTDASVAPFAFTSAFPSTSGSSDTLTATNCTSGCTINVPLLSGRIAYWRIERSPNGSSGWTAGPTQVTAVQ